LEFFDATPTNNPILADATLLEEEGEEEAMSTFSSKGKLDLNASKSEGTQSFHQKGLREPFRSV